MASFSRRRAWSFGLPALIELFDGDRAEVAGLLGAAIGSIVHDVAEIAVAASEDRRHTLVEVAHRLKGTSGTIDARHIFRITTLLEQAAHERPEALAALVAELRLAIADVEADIAAYLESD